MLWLTVDFTRGIYAQAALYCVFIGFNIYGWMQWNKKDKSIIYPSEMLEPLVKKLIKAQTEREGLKSDIDIEPMNHNDTVALLEIIRKLPQY